jgi:ADP-ribose pyrophosphatase YjhB (NUDIX family)
MNAVEKTHLGVYGVLVHEGQILLIKKARGPYTGKLDLPGGKLEHGEDLQVALAREFLEETGVVVKSAALLTNLTARVRFESEGEEIEMYHVGLIYKITDYDLSGLDTGKRFEDSAGPVWLAVKDAKTGNLSPFVAAIVTNHL